MEITGIVNNTGSRLLYKDFQPGQRLNVEIIQKTSPTEGIILIAGKEVPAVLETFAEAGDRIWVKVSRSNENELVLVRENLQQSKSTLMLNRQDQIMNERGLPANDELQKLVQNFTNLKPEINIYIQGAIDGSLSTVLKDMSSEILQTVPSWSTFEDGQNSQQILSYLKALGLNYEKLVSDFLIKGKSFETVLDFKKNLKYKILNYLQEKGENISSAERGRFEQLLQDLTGQQLWLRTGDWDNAYVLFQFPVLEQNNLHQIKVAMESFRQGGKMDAQHCHLAILADTPSFGEVGIEAWIYKDIISLNILSSTPEIFRTLIDIVKQETSKSFAKIGYNLTSINLAQMEKAQEFNNFILGKRRNGVDIRT